MDNIFNAARFGMVSRKYLYDNKSTLLYSALFVLSVMVIIAMVNGYGQMKSRRTGIDNEILVMLIAFVACGYFVASNVFRRLGSKDGMISELTVPATAFEQCLARWILIVPVYIVFVLICVWIADMAKYCVFGLISGGNVEMIPWGRIFDFNNSYYVDNIYMFLQLFVFTQSFYFLGAVVWRKHNFIKTFLVVGLIFMLYGTIMVKVASGISYENSYINVSERDYFLYLPMTLLMWACTFVNYVLTVMRLKETNLVHTW